MKRLLVLLVACLAAITACSSSGGGGQETGTSIPSSAGASVPTGQAISVGVVSADSGANVSPQRADGIEAYAKYINDHGGIDGRPLRIVRCDEKGDPTAHAACVRQFIGDPSVIAAIPGADAFTGDVGMPAYAAANLPVIDPAPVSAPEFASTVTVALNGGNSVVYGTIIQYLAATQHARTYAFTGPDNAGNQAAAQVAHDWVARSNQTMKEVLFPPTATDLVPTTTALVSADADVIFASLVPNQSAPMLAAFQQAGNTATIAIPPQSLPPDVIKQAGAAADGVITASFYPNPSTAQEKSLYAGYVTAIGALGKPAADVSFYGFLAGEVLRRYIESAGGASATRASVLHAVQTDDLQDVPFLPAVFGRSQAPDKSTLGALGNPTAYPAKIQNGSIVIIGDKTNPYGS